MYTGWWEGRVPLGDKVDGPREWVRFHMVPQTIVDHPERRRCVQPQGRDLPGLRGLGVWCFFSHVVHL